MSGIRVTYSGLISFGVGMGTILTGIIFTLIVTRQLTSNELGIWTLIGGLISYVIITESTISYWVTREIARGIESGKTAIFVSGIMSVFGMVIFVIIVYMSAEQFNVEKNILLFGVIMIPVIILDRTLSAINLGWKPQAASYALLVFEIVKIPVGLVFVYYLDLGINGAIFATFSGYLISSIVSLYIARKKINNKIQIKIIKKWIKLSWLTYYPQLSNMISKFDVLAYSIIIGSVTGLAYYTAAFTIGALVLQSGSISRAIYPKLLGEKNHEYFQENIIRMCYFLIPLTALSIAFVRPALFALNPIYEIAIIVAMLMIIKMVFVTFTSVFYLALTGIEKVDVNESSTFQDYMKSKLFTLPSISILQASIYLIGLTIILSVFVADDNEEIEYVVLWSIIALFTEIPLTIYLFFKVKKAFVLTIDYKIILKYALASIISFGSAYWLSNEFLEFKVSIFEFLPDLISYVMFGVASYLIITYLIDKRTKSLFNAIINELKHK